MLPDNGIVLHKLQLVLHSSRVFPRDVEVACACRRHQLHSQTLQLRLGHLPVGYPPKKGAELTS